MSKKTALGAVFSAVLMDLLGFGIVLPLLPYYAARFEAAPITVGLLYSVYSFAQLVFSPLWGAWSDRIGRRPVMLLSTAGSTGSYLLFAFSNSLPMLFLSRLFAGVMGGNISAAQAYVADVTAPSERAKGMGLIGAAFGIGFALGPAISSLLLMPGVHEAIVARLPGPVSVYISENPYSLPGLAASLLSFCSFLLVAFWLPESVSSQATDDGARIQRISLFSRRFWSSVFSKDAQTLGRLYVCLLVLMVGHSSLYSSFPLYCKKVFAFDAHEVGAQFLLLGLVTITVQGGLIRPLVKRFGEKRLLVAGNVLMALGLLWIPAARSTFWLSSGLAVLAVGASLNGPTLTSLVSKEAKPAYVGLALGNAQGIAALGRVLGPAWGGWLFGWRPSAPFLLTAALVSVTVWLALSLKLDKIS